MKRTKADRACGTNAPNTLFTTRHRWAAFMLFAGTVFCGCSDGLQRLEGRVLVDGKPAMKGVQVFLYAQGDHWGAQARVAADGRFTMATNGRNGVMKGTYKVVLINSFESIQAESFAPDELEAARREGRPPKGWAEYQKKTNDFLAKPPTGPGWIPKVYAELATTPLTLEVPGAGNPVTIDVPSTPPEGAQQPALQSAFLLAGLSPFPFKSGECFSDR